MRKVWWAAVPVLLVSALTAGCTPVVKATPYDFDGDGRADRVVINGSTGEWRSIEPGHPFSFQGEANDIPVPGDYDGDGRIDAVVVRGDDWVRSDGVIVAHLPTPVVDTFGLGFGPGLPHALPVPGDYDGDGRTEAAWFQEDTATWTFADGHTTVWGHGPTDPHGCCLVNLDADIAAPADYDGDGTTDLAVFNPVTGRWLIRNSHDGSSRTVTLLSNPHDDVQALAAPGDYDGVGHAQPAELTPYGLVIEGHTEKLPLAANPVTVAEIPASADFNGIGHDTPSFVNYENGEWLIAERWRLSGIEPPVTPGPHNLNYLWYPVTYPYALRATTVRTIFVDRNYLACNQGHMAGADCNVPS